MWKKVIVTINNKNKNNYKIKVTTIDGNCGYRYEENLKSFRKGKRGVKETT